MYCRTCRYNSAAHLWLIVCVGNRKRDRGGGMQLQKWKMNVWRAVLILWRAVASKLMYGKCCKVTYQLCLQFHI